MYIFIILGVPLFLSILSFLSGKSKTLHVWNCLGHLILVAASIRLIFDLEAAGSPMAFFDLFYIDNLSAFFILIISLIDLASAVYSIAYIKRDLNQGALSPDKPAYYYGLFNLFAFTMYFVTIVNNLGMMWVAIEMTTLVSAFLVGFYNNKRSVEAAWKYIIICSVGITLALLGTILVYYTASRDGGINSLNWTDIISVAKKLNPRVMKMAFLFILVGYGTKAGLAPMHTWLPDAHSQAPAPISALLSGVLLKTALYAIMRFVAIINRCVDAHYSGNLLILFGLISLVLSAGFILVQKDLKRLLAYSSIEHIGIISLGLGFGGAVGLYGALFHVFNHAVNKSLVFFGAGDIVKVYKTNEMHNMRGVVNAIPFTGIVVILGAFALAGSPPFSIFVSEIIIAVAGFQSGAYIQTAVYLLLAALIFGAVIYHLSNIIFGKKPEGIAKAGEPASEKLLFIGMFILICFMGLLTPVFFNKLLTSAAGIIRGA